ncbi:DEKNAAC101398 [Brettanomyces naardenensis]|uniref:assimilatory sulfite reductase (NADPH) n=1 Tax=Brettanomyces naardenensis TaxID=13370 RepID=A0A448YI60_BRENA|nr:DEKNAAC101398 [Brettanomyces naardenensis]
MTVSEASDTESDSSSVAGLSSANIEAPFGYPLDPYDLHGNVLTTPYRVIQATSYLLSSTIFNYTLPGKANGPSAKLPSAKDNLLKLWTTLKRKNLKNEIPQLYNVDVATGCGTVLLGYIGERGAHDSSDVTVLGSTATLEYLASTLHATNSTLKNLPVSLQIATVDYDYASGKLVSNFARALDAARTLKLPVLASSSPIEAQHFSILSSALAKLGVPNVHLFDGLKSLRVSQSISGVLSSAQVQKLESQLVSSLGASGVQSALSTDRIALSLANLNEFLGTKYEPFEFYGFKEEAKTVFVVSGTDEFTTTLFKQIGKFSTAAASIIVKAPLPFDSSRFNGLVSGKHVKKIVIVSEAPHGVSSLKLDVQASLLLEGNFSLDVVDVSGKPGDSFTAEKFQLLLQQHADTRPFLASTGSSFRFLFEDNFPHTGVPAKLAFGLSMVPDLAVKYRPIYDNSVDAGLFAVDIQAGKDFTGKFSLVFVQSFELLNKVDVFSILKPNGTILVINPLDTKFDAKKVAQKKLSAATRRILARKKINIHVLDLNSVGVDDATNRLTAPMAMHVAFWSFAYPDFQVTPMVNKIWNSYGPSNELLAPIILNLVNKVRKDGFKELPFEPEWAKEQDEVSLPLAKIGDTSFLPNPREKFTEGSDTQVKSGLDLAKKLIFKEAYNSRRALRPDEPVKNFVIRVKENKRVTPDDYNRNIFHIEFDITGTGLKYNIGEALGIHGRNNGAAVDSFIKGYGGLKANDLVETVSKENSSVLEVRTLRQSLTENLDLLGKPSKRFYESLAEFATDDKEKKTLKHLVSPAGAELLKQYQDEEYYSYADVFGLFKSARPSAQDLVSLIPPLKRREYSIASSQKVHPNAVHLLVVVVDWVDKQGRKRYGQCSKYLSDLQVGDPVVVSVKPSLMKLPPATTQPVIMAGLGTGLAPFKAFVEERQYQKEHGEDIGEIYLYLGSRHKKQEYLYGEYWEAYLSSHILTYVGAAFSRDQPQKVYIQDKIRENLDELTELVCRKDGHFYLCGPTWPVPDITACLEDIYTSEAAKTGKKIDAAEEVEKMKEEGRYVLEVY